MKLFCYLPLMTLASLLLLNCCHKKDPAPVEQLPAITQTGANIFGCLLNGKVWMPNDNDGTSNYFVVYDPTYGEGTFNLQSYRFPSNDDTDKQTIVLNSFKLTSVGTYLYTNRRLNRVIFTDCKANCRYDSYDSLTTYSTGSHTITRLDLSKGIISGTFEFTLAKTGCDTIKVTNGRFDKQL